MADQDKKTIKNKNSGISRRRFLKLSKDMVIGIGEGWDESSGYPKRSTLESLGLDYVADELEENNKLGKE